MAYNPSSYWNEIFKQGVNAQSVCYPDWPLSYNHFLHLQQLKTFEEILLSNNIDLKNKSILEIGPGAGFWTSFFSHQQTSNYTGIDISLPVVNSLQKNFPTLQFIQADIGNSIPKEISTQKVDIIFAAMVFLHITDNDKLEHAFEQLNNMLLPGGYIIFLDSFYTKKISGATKKQTDGNDFDNSFHNKIRSVDFYKKIAISYNLRVEHIIPAFNTSQFCFDFNTKLGYLIWGKLFYAFHRRLLTHANEKVGFFYSKIQQLLDGFLTKTLKFGMSSKWMVLKKL